ncbi:MAG: VOC family protein [Alphaproteobacteria bacterium]|jgi:hypothetical protein|nr:VOC family protein [Alphaproteobacteria bacterium]
MAAVMENGRGIDHLVLAVRDLGAAEAFFAAAGFTLTPRADHPFGTSNHLAILNGNFLELLAITAPAKIPPPTTGHYGIGGQMQDFLARRQGLAFVVLSSDDARRDHASFLAAGLPTFEPVDFSRAAGQPDGGQATMSFSIVFVVDPAMPDAPHFVCQQHTPEHFWHPEYQSHANAAEAISEVTLIADRPADLMPYYAGLVAPNAVHAEGERLLVETPTGRITVLAPDALAARFAGIEVPLCAPRPYVAGMQFRSADLAATEASLGRGGVDHVKADNALRIAPAAAFGAAIEFVEG